MIKTGTFNIVIPVAPKSVQHGARARLVRRPFPRILFYNDSAKEEYQNSIVVEIEHLKPTEPLDCPLSVEFAFFLERPQYLMKFKSDEALEHFGHCDLDNLVKGCADGITKGGYWKDDKLIFKFCATKWWAEEPLGPRIEIEITTYEKPKMPKS